MHKKNCLDQKTKIKDPESFLEEPLVLKFIDGMSKVFFKNVFDCEVFSGQFLIKLMENDYSALRNYGGKSSRKTYLTSIGRRLAIDLKRHQFGRDYGRCRNGGSLPKFLEKSDSMTTLIYELMVVKKMTLSSAYENLRVLAPEFDKSYSRFIEIAEQFPDRKNSNGPSRKPHLLEVFKNNHPIQPPNQCITLEKNQIKDILFKVIKSLDLTQKSLITLTFFQKLPAREAAKSIGIQESTFRKRLARTLKTMRSALENQGIDSSSFCDLATVE